MRQAPANTSMSQLGDGTASVITSMRGGPAAGGSPRAGGSPKLESVCVAARAGARAPSRMCRSAARRGSPGSLRLPKPASRPPLITRASTRIIDRDSKVRHAASPRTPTRPRCATQSPKSEGGSAAASPAGSGSLPGKGLLKRQQSITSGLIRSGAVPAGAGAGPPAHARSRRSWVRRSAGSAQRHGADRGDALRRAQAQDRARGHEHGGCPRWPAREPSPRARRRAAARAVPARSGRPRAACSWRAPQARPRRRPSRSRGPRRAPLPTRRPARKPWAAAAAWTTKNLCRRRWSARPLATGCFCADTARRTTCRTPSSSRRPRRCGLRRARSP
jgi:hypothetical protein